MSNVDDTTTTFYFEEITDDPIPIPTTAATSDEEENKEDEESDRQRVDIDSFTGSVNINERSREEDENIQNLSALPPIVVYKNLESCPFSIGGGATLTVVGRHAFVFGGCSRSGKPSGYIHRYSIDLNKWDCNIVCGTVEGPPPQARFGHSAVAYKEYIYVFGGQGFSNSRADDNNKSSYCDLASLQDFHRLNTRTMEWTAVISDEHHFPWPEARNSHTCVLHLEDEHDDNDDGSKMILFGGSNEQCGPQNDIWSFSLKTHIWSQIQYKGDGEIPCEREMHSACINVGHQCCMYVMGGRNVDGGVCRDFWRLNLGDYVWTQLSRPPSPRCAHTTSLIRMRSGYGIYSFGGWDGYNNIFDDCSVYDLDTELWLQTPAEIIPSSSISVPRFAHALCTFNDSNDNIDDKGKGYVALLFGGANMLSDLRDLVLVRGTMDQ